MPEHPKYLLVLHTSEHRSLQESVVPKYNTIYSSFNVKVSFFLIIYRRWRLCLQLANGGSNFYIDVQRVRWRRKSQKSGIQYLPIDFISFPVESLTADYRDIALKDERTQ